MTLVHEFKKIIEEQLKNYHQYQYPNKNETESISIGFIPWLRLINARYITSLYHEMVSHCNKNHAIYRLCSKLASSNVISQFSDEVV